MQVRGRAHQSYAGKVIHLFTASDFITGIKQKETADTIGSDGTFEMPLQSEYTQPVFLKIDNVLSELYVQPDFVYGITIPELDNEKNVNPDVELKVNIGIIGSDSTELNALIFDYQEQYNKLFISNDEKYLARNSMFRRVDSLHRQCMKRYSGVKNDYFINYVQYSLASVNASLSRGELYLMETYISGKPIRYTHYEYMQFFNAFFRGYLDRIASRRKGQSLYNIVNSRADYDALLNFVRFEKELKSDSLRELIIIKNMWDCYFSADFEPEAVARIVSQINVQTNNKEHKRITANMLTFFNKLQPGAPAPGFSALAKDGKTVGLTAYKGRWIYLNFFSTKNTESLKEMPKIAALKKKFGDKVIFLSICLDDTLASYKNYIRANPRFDWAIWYNYDRSFTSTAKEVYGVTGTEAYFLINNSGHLAQSPATPPSRGIEFKLNQIFKIKPRNTKTGIR